MPLPSEATTAIDFRILGPLEVRGGDLAIDPKAKCLLGILVLDANRFLSTEELIDHLYGEDPPQSARNGIQKYVGLLNKELAATNTSASIETRGRGAAYSLQLRAAGVDLTLFHELVENGRAALARQDAEAAAEALRAATELWRGRPFTDLNGCDYLDYARETLAKEHMEARELKFEAELGDPETNPENLARELQALCEADPLSSSIAGLLMWAWHLADRPEKVDDALQAFKDAWEDVKGRGAALPTKLNELYNKIQDGDPSLRPQRRSPWRLTASVDEVRGRLRMLSDHTPDLANDPISVTLQSLELTSQGMLTAFGRAYAAALRPGALEEPRDVLAGFLPSVSIVAKFLAHLDAAESLTRTEAMSALRGIAGWSDDPGDRSPSLWLQWMLDGGLLDWKHDGESRPLLIRGDIGGSDHHVNTQPLPTSAQSPAG